MPVRYLFLDEVDAYPPSADDEGEPVALAEARTRTFSWRRKVFLASTPTIDGSGLYLCSRPRDWSLPKRSSGMGRRDRRTVRRRDQLLVQRPVVGET
jgi:hypothetical protein